MERVFFHPRRIEHDLNVHKDSLMFNTEQCAGFGLYEELIMQ